MRRGPAPPHTVSPPDDRFARWIAALEAKHLAELTFPEVSRALRALSSTYVERAAEARRRRGAVGRRQARGLRAVLRPAPPSPASTHIVDEPARVRRANVQTLLDLGCGTGASGAAWAAACANRRRALVGIDRHPWAIGEAAATYRAFGIPATVRQGDIATVDAPERAGVDSRGVHDERAGRCGARRAARAAGRARRARAIAC